MCFVGRQRALVNIGYAARDRLLEEFGKSAIVVDNLEERLAICAQPRNSQQVFSRRVDFPNQEVVVEENNGRALAFVNIAVRWAGVFVAYLPGRLTTVFC